MPAEICIQSQVVEPNGNGNGDVITWLKEHMIEIAIVGGAAVIGTTMLATSAIKKD